MNSQIRTLKYILAFLIINLLKNLNNGIFATKVLNVRHTHMMKSRSLLFPPTAPTRLQFIGGIGIPVEDLNFESVTSGYVLKAEYFLPEKAEEFRKKLRPQTIHRRRRSINDTVLFRANEVDFIGSAFSNKVNDNMFSNRGSNSSKKFNSEVHWSNNIYQNINNWKNQQKQGALYRWIIYKAIEILLNKSSLHGNACMLRSICEHAAVPLNYEGGLLAEIIHIVLTPSSSRDECVESSHKNYLRAEVLGRSGENCTKAFGKCSKSPLEIISLVFET